MGMLRSDRLAIVGIGGLVHGCLLPLLDFCYFCDQIINYKKVRNAY